MYGIIYRITNQLDGKPYVGQTVRTLEERFQEHTQADSYIGNAIRAHGEENFTCEVIEECDTREQLNEREIFWIAELNSKHPNGYNLTDGGEGGIPCDVVRAKIAAARTGKHPTDETRAKMSAAHKNPSAETRAKLSASKTGEKNHFYGKHHTPETKAKISVAKKNPSDETRAKLSKASKGRKKSPETCAKLSATHMGEKNNFFGKHHTEKSKAKNSASNRKESSYKNLLVEMDAHQITYRGLAKILGLAQPTISQKMSGEYNFTAEQIAKLVEIFDKPAEYLMAHD